MYNLVRFQIPIEILALIEKQYQFAVPSTHNVRNYGYLSLSLSLSLIFFTRQTKSTRIKVELMNNFHIL